MNNICGGTKKLAQKKSYSRYFIILQEDEKGYSLGVDKSSSGYVKMEVKDTKCKISYYVQNIKKESAPYYMILICNKKDTNSIIKIGEMNIDEYGRADICYEYPVNNISNSGLGIDKVSGAAIVKFIDSNIISVMSGFSTTDIPRWKGFDIANNKVKEAKIKPQKKDNRSIFDEYEEKIEEVKNSKKVQSDDNIKKNKCNIELSLKEENLEEKSLKEENLKEEDLKEKIRKDKSQEFTKNKDNNLFIDDSIKNKPQIDNKSCKENYEYPLGEDGKYFKNIAKDLEIISDFADQIKRCKWYKVEIENIDDMKNTCDYDKYMILYNPMNSYYNYIKKYGHYLLGYKCDELGSVKYIVYGIPGEKSKEDQPYGGKSGFVTWVPTKSEKQGYWLMFYDYKTSTVVLPVK